ncbi:hypothetical protein P4V41_07865 [Fictibacillus nanhaiensis]|uniref:hypothetical protein n=1 Tax=Fictibacillus nanhaiensis TaxID=742169 RepID=UPI002E1EA216|nr:hypothetical protein [Fictibacillus nanhaiensis]
MYKSLQTIILEDTFGRDNQYLKGHTYDLNHSYWTSENINGRSVQSFHSQKILSDENIKQYFTYIEPQIIRGGHGHRTLGSD